CYFASLLVFVLSTFFSQAEDGIRDRNVTGVQTCALPICVEQITDREVQLRDPTLAYPIFRAENRENFERMLSQDERNHAVRVDRSEERRVGKECRCRRAQYGEKKRREKDVTAGGRRA